LFDKVHASRASPCPGDIYFDESSDEDVLEVKKTIESDKLGTLKKATKSGKRKHNDCSL
jgi:hypothetical protein